jgi:hypothetical protein
MSLVRWMRSFGRSIRRVTLGLIALHFAVLVLPQWVLLVADHPDERLAWLVVFTFLPFYVVATSLIEALYVWAIWRIADEGAGAVGRRLGALAGGMALTIAALVSLAAAALVAFWPHTPLYVLILGLPSLPVAALATAAGSIVDLSRRRVRHGH